MPPKVGDKRTAPISSSAFSFSIGTTAKKPKSKPPQAGLPSVPSPLRTPLSRTAVAAHTPSRQVTPMTDKRRLDVLPSPFSITQGRAESPAGSRQVQRISAVLDDSPFRVSSRNVAMHTLPPPSMAIKEQERIINAEEGIGVSPRKFKGGIQHKGPRPPPSVRLASILSASNTSVVLFNTSLQHAVQSIRSRDPAANAPLQHIRAAAQVRLEVIDPSGGRTQAAVIHRCRVRTWPLTPAPDTVLVVFQGLPGDCQPVGVDPRIIATGGSTYEVGLWQPWTERTVPGQAEEETVLFASRYLIAEVV